MKFVMMLTLLLLTLAGTAAAQDNVVEFDGYEIHYSAFPSTFLPAEVADANDLRRSKGLGVVNIVIMTEGDDGTLKTVSGQVEGKVLNDVRQPTFLAFRRIQDGDATYFIAQYQYSSGALMTFEITARPSGHNQDLPLRFSQTLFND